MNKRKSKKIFLGLSILSFLVSGITATSIFWSFNKNFSDYEKIYTELKKARDLVNSPNYKKSADDILKNPNYKTFSRENVADINEVLSKIIVQIDKEIKVYISKINSASKKVKLNTDLLNSQNSIDAKRKIKDNALKLIDIELVKDINLEKIEAKKLIENIKNSTKKAEFEKKLPFIKSINDIELLISDVEKELKKQSINDYISAKKKALIAKKNASTLNKEEKKKLLELFKDLKTTSTLFDNEIIINYEILKDALKKQAANRIELLENDNFKKIIKNSFGKAKTIKDYYDILIRINEHEFGRINNPKIDSKDKTDLLNKIGQIKTIITPSDNVLANDYGIKMIINETILDLKNSLDYLEKNEVQNKKSELDELIKKLTELKKEIGDLKNTGVLEYSKTRKELAKRLAKSKDDQSIEDTKLYIKKAKLKKKAGELPYPNGVDSVAIYEINSRIDSTKKDNLKSIEDLISKLPKKINEAKELIAQISKSGKDINGQRTKDLNNQLSRSVDDKDFDKLKENIQKAKNQSDDDYKKDLVRRLKDQVNSLHYPKDARAKENLKAQIDKLSDEELETFGHTIDEIAKNVESVKSSIESIPKRNKDDERAVDEFNKIFSTADNVKKLKDLKKLVDNYNDIANRLNSFTLYNAPEIYQEDLVTANNALNELKSSLWSKLSMLTRFDSQQDLRKLIDADYELYKETKKLNGDILVAAQFLNEAKSKANVEDVSIIKNKIQPYKNQLNRFWTADKGDYLRQNIDQWFTSISEDESNITNPDQYRFLSYKLLLKKLRTRQNDEQVKKIVDDEVEQYKALIEFKRVYDNTNSSIPENVKKSLKAKILNVPENATKADMDLITKYLGQRVETNNKLISGFYLDAKQLLDFVLNNNSGKESNKAHFQSLFNDIGVATSGQNYDTEITTKIDNFRKEINTFISKLKEVKEKIKNLTNIVTTADKKVIFENELAKADYKDFDNLINIINKYNEAAKLLDQIKHRNDKTNLIGQLSSASTLEQILDITKKIEKRVKEIAEAKQKLKDTVNKIPEKDNVSKDIKNKYKERLKNIDNAELSEINKIIEESELEIKRSQTRDYVDNLLGDSTKSENKKRGELITKLLDPNKSSTFATIDELKKEADEEFKKYKKSVIDRAHKELLENAASYLPSTSGGGKIWVENEDSYYMWYKDEINKKTNFNDIDNLENSFIFGRYADSIRVRAIINSMLYHLEHTTFIKNRHNTDLYNKYLDFIKKYVESYALNDDLRNRDKDYGFTINDFWRSLNLFINKNNSTSSFDDQKIREDIGKTFSLVAQVMAPKGDIHNAGDTMVSNIIEKSIISKTLAKFKKNYLDHHQYKKEEVFTLIRKLFTSTVTDKRSTTYEKILELKNDDHFGNIIKGNGKKGLLKDAELWNFADKPENI